MHRCLIVLLLACLSGMTVSFADASYPYNPGDITLRDNAYNVTSYPRLQWWYLDAMFDNNYSAHIGILTIGSHGTYGIFLFQMQLYKDGQVLEKQMKSTALRNVRVSTETLSIIYGGTETIRGYFRENDTMAVDVNLRINNLTANLSFVGETKGWKGATGHGMWGCPLPKASVSGSITLNDQLIPVNGTGYQEHGWDVRHLHKSWYWGKCSSEHMNLIFSQNMKNKHQEDVFIAVLNTNDDSYTSFARDSIVLSQTNYTWSHGRFIPMTTLVQINQDPIHIDLKFQVQTIDYVSVFGMHYWRFHAKVTGTMTNEVLTDHVDETQIVEIFHHP
jgi:predicted secreted hydrolase